VRAHVHPTAFAAACTLVAAGWLTLRPDETARIADKYLRAQEISTQFSGTVLVARHGEVVFAGAYGYADVERRVRNELGTQYRIGSITKPFTATLVMTLQEDGLLATGDPICRYVDACPAHWSGITLHHLLSHTSGIPDLLGGEDYLARTAQPATWDEVLAEFRDAPLRFAPGARFEYSNPNYHLLGRVVERVTGRTYGEALADRIFRPLGLASSFMDSSSRSSSRVAVGYRPDDDGTLRSDSPYDPVWSFASGGVFSTAEDLLRFHRALLAGELLSESVLELMWTPVAGTYGYGWNMPDSSPETLNRRVRMHSGRTPGYTACFVEFLDDELTAIVLSNNVMGDMCGIARDLAAIHLGEAYTIPSARRAIRLDAAVLSRYEGRYRVNDAVTAVITRAGDNLVLELEGSPDRFPLFAESETSFFLKTSDAQVEFVTNRRGETTAATVQSAGRSFAIERLGD
jgi:CubicO group peptidase (beta-lactamase class C family)